MTRRRRRFRTPAVPTAAKPRPSPFRWTPQTPTISSTAYYSEAAGTNTLSSTTGADEIYTIVTFSEKQRETVSDTIGLPRIAYRIGSTGTETEYDIIASDGTLASGDCQETGTNTNDGKIYTCRYDTTGTPSGDFKTYTKTYKDTAGNAGTAETYATNTGKVAIAASVAKTITVSAVSTDNYINATEDDSDITVSGTSTGLTQGTTVTVTADDSDADSNADITKSPTTDASGNWSATFTSAEVGALDEGFVVITAASTGATSGTRAIVYDATAPTVATASYTSSAITLIFSEPVYGDVTTADFTPASHGSATVSSVTKAATAGAAGKAATVTLSGAITGTTPDPVLLGGGLPRA